ncbi:MAG: HK97 gp10 family phage protein [Cytophagales bacterium]|nr:HK97 gp10 family phage protein [Cytophagales bacterium]
MKNIGGARQSIRLQAENLEAKIKRAVETAGRFGELEAVKKVPVDLGDLKQSISSEPINKGFGWRLTANERYAPYQEFGTGGLVEIPEGFEGVAAQFRKGGHMNMPPQPFLIPAAKKAYKKLIKDLKAIK